MKMESGLLNSLFNTDSSEYKNEDENIRMI